MLGTRVEHDAKKRLVFRTDAAGHCAPYGFHKAGLEVDVTVALLSRLVSHIYRA